MECPSVAFPTFRTDTDAVKFAEINQPFHRALSEPNGPDYARRYGKGVADAAEHCRQAAIRGDDHALHLGMSAMSLRLQVQSADYRMAA